MHEVTFESKPMIVLSEILDQSCIRLDMPESDKEQIIQAMVQSLADSGVVSDVRQMTTDIHKREAQMSTGIGGGIAIPHARSTGAGRLALALGRPARPVDFEALDERPVQLVFMVVGPADGEGFIRVLARISRLQYSGNLQRHLLRARTPNEVKEILRFEESRITG